MRRTHHVPLAAAALVAVALVTAACGGDGRTPLVIYSPHGKDLLAHYEQQFEAANPDIDVQWIDMGSQDVLDRLRAEKANPQADIWFGAPSETFARAAREGLLAPYRPTWADQVSSEARDTEDRWYGTYLTPEVIGYNTEAVPADQVPQDWDDVLDPRWAGKVVIRDPMPSGSMRAIFGAILLRSLQTTGSTEQGWDWLRRLDASTREYVINPTMLFQKLGQREGLITVFAMPDIGMVRDRYPVDFRIPSSGTPLLVDAIALVQGGRNPDAARRYYEFVTSPAVLQEAAARFVRIPARTDIPADSLPQWIRQAQSEIRPMPLDARMLADSLDGWMRYWDANIRNRSRR
jgi:iron(III) transport system substrate-binding protein